MPATLATVAALTKELYEGSIREQINNEAVGLKRIERSGEGVTSDVGGKYVTFPIHTRRNAGIGARNELEQLPVAGQQGYAAARVGLKYLYGRVRLSGQTFELVETNAQAFASALSQEMSGLKNDLTKDQNRQFYGNGTGTMGVTVGATAGTNTVTVVSTQYLELGQQIDIVAPGGGTVRAANRQITAINLTSKVVTFDGAVATTVTADLIIRTGNYGREITGLASIVSNAGVLYNIDPAVEPTWASVVDSNAGTLRALSEGLMIFDADQVRINGSYPTLWLSNLGVRRAYFNLLVQQRRFTNTQEFAGGFKGLAFTTDKGDIPFVSDIDAPPNTLYGINEGEIKLYQSSDWSFMNRDGGMWKWVHDFDAFEAVMRKYCEIGTHRRNAHVVIKDITEG